MDAIKLLRACKSAGVNFFTGVPDSQLKGLCDTLYDLYGVEDEHHIVAANEGGAMGLACGHYLATGHPALVYMQNSGLGNIVNPYCSLLAPEVYHVPCLLVIGWRGEPGVHDEPQHVFQGEVTLEQLDVLKIPYFILDKSISDEQFDTAFERIRARLSQGLCAAIVVRKGGLSTSRKPAYTNGYSMGREQAAELIARMAGERDIFVSTTGKLSRELFEIRERLAQGHAKDFLTVGGMGHASMIAMGIALKKPDRRVWCLDGDGAAVMHLGSMSVLAKRAPQNLIHVIINNGAHETVGGMPVAQGVMSFTKIAKDLGYAETFRTENITELQDAVRHTLCHCTLTLIEVCCTLGARDDLGRPTTTPVQNRDTFMDYVKGGAEQ